MPDLDIPFNDLSRYEPTVARRIRAATSRVVSSGPYVLGPEVEKFETEFAAYCGRRHCVAVGNGTDAIELALRAVGVEAGARVGTVANAGMYASVAALAIGATPVYVDVDSADHNLCPTKLSDDVLSTLDALVVTHLYGRMANMPAIHEYAKRHSVPIIEDCAQAHGASLGGRPAGSWGAAGCFSFYPTKNLGALGDAGAVVSSDDEIACYCANTAGVNEASLRLAADATAGWTRFRQPFCASSCRNSIVGTVCAAKSASPTTPRSARRAWRDPLRPPTQNRM